MTEEEQIQADENLKRFIKWLRQYWVLILATFIIAFGLWIAFKVIRNYQEWNHANVHFGPSSSIPSKQEGTANKNTFMDLATVLTGTTGLVFTLAGIILFFYTIKQTKDEMVATQKILSRQLAETTLFNLMKNYRENIYPAIRKEFDDDSLEFVMVLRRYAINLRGKQFRSIEDTQAHPYQVFAELDKLNYVVGNIIHIANHIQEYFKDDQVISTSKDRLFFHKTLYYFLNHNEKIAVGFYLANFERYKINEYPFDYSEELRKTRHFISEKKTGFFPPISLEYPSYHLYTYLKADYSLIDSEIETFKQLTRFIFTLDSKVKLIEIIPFIKQFITIAPHATKVLEARGNPILLEGFEHDLLKMYLNEISPLFNPTTKIIHLNFHYYFEYLNQKYVVLSDNFSFELKEPLLMEGENVDIKYQLEVSRNPIQ